MQRRVTLDGKRDGTSTGDSDGDFLAKTKRGERERKEIRGCLCYSRVLYVSLQCVL